MTPISNMRKGDHLALKKDHFKGDHLTSPKPLKSNANAVLGGHFNPFYDSDRGGHLFTPPFIRGVNSGTHAMTTH